MTDLYRHYRERVREANHPWDFDQIIDSAYRDYVKDHLTDVEYSRIYFACIARQNTL